MGRGERRAGRCVEGGRVTVADGAPISAWPPQWHSTADEPPPHRTPSPNPFPIPGRFALPVPAFLRGGASPASSSSAPAQPSPPRRRSAPNVTATALADVNTLDNGPVGDGEYEGEFEEAELDQDFTIKRITGDGRCMFRALVSFFFFWVTASGERRRRRANLATG
jgi:hypothetical protein